MSEPTRVTKRVVAADGSFTEEVTDTLCSVELKLTAKGAVTVEGVKVYAMNEQEAGQRARDEMERCLAWAAGKGGA